MKLSFSPVFLSAVCLLQNSNNAVHSFTLPVPSSTSLPAKYASPSFQSFQLHSVALNEELVTSSSSSSSSPTITATETKDEKSYLDDGFIFGMEGSGLSRPKGKVAQIVVEGDSLDTQPYQIALVSATFLNHAFMSLFAMNQLLSINHGSYTMTIAQSLVTIVSSWVIADLGSGVLHWSVDNYGNGRTPIMGNIIAAFQGHHTAQWTITERQFCNNVHKLCIPFGIPTVGLIALLAGSSHPLVTLFFAVFCAMEIMSQEFHKWSHMTKSQVSPIINKLQDAKLTIGRTSHAMHHLQPFDGNYCIISGICNDFLDSSGAFRRMEHVVWKLNGVEANAWKLDSKLKERTLRGDYSLPEGSRRLKQN